MDPRMKEVDPKYRKVADFLVTSVAVLIAVSALALAVRVVVYIIGEIGAAL